MDRCVHVYYMLEHVHVCKVDFHRTHNVCQTLSVDYAVQCIQHRCTSCRLKLVHNNFDAGTS